LQHASLESILIAIKLLSHAPEEAQMSKYLLLYMSTVSPEEQIANASPEEGQAGMEAWTAWANRAGSAVVDLGAPTGAAGSVGAGRPDASADHRYVGGYSIMQADSPRALQELLRDHPHLMLEGSSIEFFEFLELPGAPA
jgi:hypothetical protein